jgi:hypothetical protein
MAQGPDSDQLRLIVARAVFHPRTTNFIHRRVNAPDFYALRRGSNRMALPLEIAATSCCESICRKFSI